MRTELKLNRSATSTTAAIKFVFSSEFTLLSYSYSDVNHRELKFKECFSCSEFALIKHRPCWKQPWESTANINYSVIKGKRETETKQSCWILQLGTPQAFFIVCLHLELTVCTLVKTFLIKWIHIDYNAKFFKYKIVGFLVIPSR